MYISIFLKPHKDSWKDHSESITLNCKEKKRGARSGILDAGGHAAARWAGPRKPDPGWRRGKLRGHAGLRRRWQHALPEAGASASRAGSLPAPRARRGDRPSLSRAENPRLVLSGGCHSLFRLLQRSAQPGWLQSSRGVFLTGLEGARGRGSGVIVSWPAPPLPGPPASTSSSSHGGRPEKALGPLL